MLKQMTISVEEDVYDTLAPFAEQHILGDFIAQLVRAEWAPAKADPEEPLPRVSRAEREERRKRRKDDPVWQVLDQPVEHDSSWLPEGLTFETFLVKDVRDIIIKDKYGL